jgi:hypothetical protein
VALRRVRDDENMWPPGKHVAGGHGREIEFVCGEWRRERILEGN